MEKQRVGLSTDHGGYELKQYLAAKLTSAGFEVVDFGAAEYAPDDDYPDFVLPMVTAIAKESLSRGIAICGSGVGVAVAANKVKGVRACLIHDTFSARQGVEDDNINVLCLGGRVIGHELAWVVVQTFLAARFSGEARHVRRLAKVAEAS